jgi:hypothetical protein
MVLSSTSQFDNGTPQQGIMDLAKRARWDREIALSFVRLRGSKKIICSRLIGNHTN